MRRAICTLRRIRLRSLTASTYSAFGGWLQRLQANDILVQDQYGQVSFTNLQTFLQGKVSTYTYAPSYTPLSWRSLEGAFYVEDAIKLKTFVGAAHWLSG